jgi:DNA sulfur modification protein DndB
MTEKNKNKEIILPALRGVMGRWVYYSCLMSLNEVAKRVSYADEIHKNEKLSDMIQRSLKSVRSKQIAEYIENQDERFFNSLVVATYGGQPNWSSIDTLNGKGREEFVGKLSEETITSVGFLSLNGDEKLFALDGQHRLSGIKRAISEGMQQDPFDEVSVIFVGHKSSQKGLERTRRLFTTLNKTAKPVSKGDIIALDEDDVMAISVRWLIEETALFSGDRVAFVASNNMPARNTKSLTTIGNLYDVLEVLFSGAETDLKQSKADLKRARPGDEDLQKYFSLAKKYFQELAQQFKPLDEFFRSKESETVVAKYRGSHGGDALFRPIGQKVLAEVIARLTKDQSLDEAIKLCGKLPTSLSSAPYEGLMWNSSSQRISNSNGVTLREVLLYMLGASKLSQKNLLERYRRDMGDDTIELPERLV